jgi:beta-propeller repeat-containing protein
MTKSPHSVMLQLMLLHLTWLALCIAQAHGQGGVPLWTNRYNGPANKDDIPVAIAVDSNCNVFVAGTSADMVGDGFAVIKYSTDGAPLWTNRWSAPGSSENYLEALALDADGNVFVTGYGYSTTTFEDYFTLKYSNEGAPLWTNLFGTIFPDFATAIAVSDSGKVFVTGYSSGDYATISYSNEGVPLWTNRYNGARAIAIAADSSGNVFVTGYSTGNLYDYATIKYSDAGLPLWTNRYSSPGNVDDQPAGIAVDGAGDVIVTGYSNNQGISPTIKYSGAGVPIWTNFYSGHAYAIASDANGNAFATGGSNNTNGFLDYTTVAYSSAGVPLWTNRYNGPADSHDVAVAVALDSSGNVFVSGGARAINDHNDFATVAYSGGGVPLWTNLYDGPANFEDAAKAIAVDRNGNVYVTGPSTGTGIDFATIKYSSSARPWLAIQRVNDQAVLAWTNSAFSLQTAPDLTSTFTNIPGATSPYTNPITGPQQLFRLSSP